MPNLGGRGWELDASCRSVPFVFSVTRIHCFDYFGLNKWSMVFDRVDSIQAKLSSRFESVPDRGSYHQRSKELLLCCETYLIPVAVADMPSSLLFPEEESTLIQKEDCHRTKILRRHINSELMSREFLPWREIMLEHRGSKLESRIHSSIANDHRSDLDVRAALLRLRFDLYSAPTTS
jgi:hypothetical protein